MHALAVALHWGADLAHNARNPAEVDRLALEMIELSTRHNFAQWLAVGGIRRGWALSASGNPAEGIAWIEQGIRDYRATGSVLGLPHLLGMKAEALHLAGRATEALEALGEAETLAERFENRYWCAELHRLRAVFLTAMVQMTLKFTLLSVKPSARQNQQKSVSLAMRAEASYARNR